MSLLSALSLILAAGCVHVHCVHAVAATRALRWCLLTNHVVAKGVAPELVKGFDGQRERRVAADLVLWALKFFLRHGSQMRWVGDH
eukprot:2582647-Pleurochrysis_carterae.AAC.1